MGNAVKRLASLVGPYRPMSGGRQWLDAEYARGEWDYLRGPSELARFSIVAGYCRHYKPHGSILEIGCGEGLLPERLGLEGYSRYLGVDISREAIARAQPRQNERTAFVAEDAMRLHLQDRFDVIIFNECLEYFDEPLALLHRYEAFLHGTGIYIVSIFDGIDTARSWKIWRMLRRRYTAEAVIHVSNEIRYAWTIKVLRPQHQMSGPSNEPTAF
jgi:2-polyprenyl-3-methyl-5-hydroxy-6-metoxy-1,4-benzoquinol methylase